MNKPILKSPRITLRPVKISDARNFVRWFRDDEVCRYVNPGVYHISLIDDKKYIKKVSKDNNEYVYAILAEDGAHIGVAGAHLKPTTKSSGFGIIIGDKRYWGQGIAGEVIKLLGDLVFKKLKYNRFYLTVFTGNKRAIKAYQKMGFKKEGILRQNQLSKVDGKFHDEYAMSILKNEWK